MSSSLIHFSWITSAHIYPKWYVNSIGFCIHWWTWVTLDPIHLRENLFVASLESMKTLLIAQSTHSRSNFHGFLCLGRKNVTKSKVRVWRHTSGDFKEERNASIRHYSGYISIWGERWKLGVIWKVEVLQDVLVVHCMEVLAIDPNFVWLLGWSEYQGLQCYGKCREMGWRPYRWWWLRHSLYFDHWHFSCSYLVHLPLFLFYSSPYVIIGFYFYLIIVFIGVFHSVNLRTCVCHFSNNTFLKFSKIIILIHYLELVDSQHWHPSFSWYLKSMKNPRFQIKWILIIGSQHFKV